MKSLLSKPWFRQVFWFFVVGGIASVVEWVLFTILSLGLDVQYLVATVLAVICSTFVNWLLCKRWVFTEKTRFGDKISKEIAAVYLVGFLGMLANLGLMWVFVELAGFVDGWKKVLAKMVSTVIVCFSNFFVKKFIIYRPVSD